MPKRWFEAFGDIPEYALCIKESILYHVQSARLTEVIHSSEQDYGASSEHSAKSRTPSAAKGDIRKCTAVCHRHSEKGHTDLQTL